MKRPITLKIPLYPEDQIYPATHTALDPNPPYVAHLEAHHLQDLDKPQNSRSTTPSRATLWHQGKPVGSLEGEQLWVDGIGIDEPWAKEFPIVRLSGYLGEVYLEGGLYFPFTETEVDAADPNTLSTPGGYLLPVDVHHEALSLGLSGKHLLDSSDGKALRQRLLQKLHNLAGTLMADYPKPGVLVVDLSKVNEFSQSVAQELGPLFVEDLVQLLDAKPELALSLVFKGQALLLEYAFSLSPTQPAVVFEGNFRFLGLPKGMAESLKVAYNNLDLEGHVAMLRKIAQQYPWLLRKRRYTDSEGNVKTHFAGVLSKEDLQMGGVLG